jgi:hypothetical protein
MIKTLLLDHVQAVYDQMMSGDARFRMLLTMVYRKRHLTFRQLPSG